MSFSLCDQRKDAHDKLASVGGRVDGRIIKHPKLDRPSPRARDDPIEVRGGAQERVAFYSNGGERDDVVHLRYDTAQLAAADGAPY
jgi:hypothetical protein